MPRKMKGKTIKEILNIDLSSLFFLRERELLGRPPRQNTRGWKGGAEKE